MSSSKKKSKYFQQQSNDKIILLRRQLEFKNLVNIQHAKHLIDFHSNCNQRSNKTKLTKQFFTQHSTQNLAINLLGKCLCTTVNGTILRGIIVETEAYLGAEDHASYSFGGRRTDANEPMYMAAGTCFIRFTYGMYYCFNISSNDDGGAVLIRAAEPVQGIESMCKLRREHPKAPARDKFDKKSFLLANGPSKLCIAFGIDKKLNKANLLDDSRIWIEDCNQPIIEENVVKSSRIGISASNPWSDKLLRFYLKNFNSVSKK